MFLKESSLVGEDFPHTVLEFDALFKQVKSEDHRDINKQIFTILYH